MLKVAIFDDVVAARGEVFHIPGLEVEVFPHADNAAEMVARGGHDVVFMDFAMGTGRVSGDDATAALRSSGFSGRIIGISSDPVANASMRSSGADDSLGKKAHLRSYLVHLGSQHQRGRPAPLARAAVKK